MIERRNAGAWTFDIANYILLTVLTLLTIYPLVHVFFASISEGSELMAHRGVLFHPLGFSLAAYRMVWRNPNIAHGFLNTLFLLVVGTSVNIFFTSMGAYVLSRKNVYWRKLIMILIVITMFFNGGLIPFFLLVRSLGLLDSLWSLVLAFSVDAYYLIIMRTYFAGIPDSLEESAKMDGANDFVVLFRIILPVAMPVVATMLLFYGVNRWNGYFYAMVFLRHHSKYPISLILREILISGSTQDMMQGTAVADQEMISETIKYATTMVATLPILLVYPFLQKYFVRGAMVGSLKE